MINFSTALVGNGPVIVRCHEDNYLLVDCCGVDIWEFWAEYRALPSIIEYNGFRFEKTSFRSDTHTAFYKAA